MKCFAKALIRPEKVLQAHVHFIAGENFINRTHDNNVDVSEQVNRLLIIYLYWLITNMFYSNYCKTFNFCCFLALRFENS